MDELLRRWRLARVPMQVRTLYGLLLVEAQTANQIWNEGGGQYVLGRIGAYDLAIDAMERRWPPLKTWGHAMREMSCPS